MNYNWDELRHNVFTNEAMSNKSTEDYGGKMIGGALGGNFEIQMMNAVDEHEQTKQKYQKFDAKKTDYSFLRQTDKFWNPADVPE